MILLDTILEREFWRSARQADAAMRRFMHRTGLREHEVTFVNYKGRMYPQWIGAVKPMVSGRVYKERFASFSIRV